MSRYHLLGQLFRFGVVGLTAAAFHFAIVVAMVEHAGLQPLLANPFAFVIAFQLSYWGHRKWTFAGTTSLHREAFPRLVAVQTVNFAANETLFYIFLTMNLPYTAALFIVLTIFPLFTFASTRFWVFS